MKSNISELLDLRYPPLAIFFANEPPVDGKKGKGMCSMFPIAQAAKGETVYLKSGSCGCPGAASGFGLESIRPDNFPGGRECYYRFLSVGNETCEQGREAIEQMKSHGTPKIFIDEFSEGEGFLKTPELTKEFIGSIPAVEPEGRYVVIKPLENLLENEVPKVVSFLVDPNRLSALVVLANYARHGNDNVRIPFGAGCMTFGVYAFREAKQAEPKAIIGLTDISARLFLRKILDRDTLSFTVPFAFFTEMDSNAPESFLNRPAWKTVLGR